MWTSVETPVTTTSITAVRLSMRTPAWMTNLPPRESQRAGRLGGRDHDDEYGEDLPPDHPGYVVRERHEIDVGGVQDQLHPHEDGHRGAPRQDLVQAAAEKRRAHYQHLVQGHLLRLLHVGSRDVGRGRARQERRAG